ADEPAVLAAKRHHVADRTQGREIQITPSVEWATAYFVERLHQLERQPARGQLRLGVAVLDAFRVDDGDGIRQLVRNDVVIEHYHVNAKLVSESDLNDAGGAAVGGDDQRDVARGQQFDRPFVDAVTFGEAVRQIRNDPP